MMSSYTSNVTTSYIHQTGILLIAVILFSRLFTVNVLDIIHLIFLYLLEYAFLRFLLPFPTNSLPLPGKLSDLPLYLQETLFFKSSPTLTPLSIPQSIKPKLRIKLDSANTSSDSDTNVPRTPTVTKKVSIYALKPCQSLKFSN